MSRCADENCVHDHVRPHLREPKPTAGGGYRALAPCHEDATHSLSVSVDHGRVLWHCHACANRIGSEKAQRLTRAAMIRDGVPAQCLPRPADEARDLEAEIRGIVFGTDSHAHARLRIAALLEGHDGLPRGDELVALAESCGGSRREAFKARAALQPTTRTGPDEQ